MNINFKIPLRSGPLGLFDMHKTTKDAIKENIKLTILTNKKERLVNNIGSSFHFSVFDNTVEEIDDIIKSQVNSMFKEYFDYIKIDKITIKHPDNDNTLQENQVAVSIEYSYKGIDSFSDKIAVVLK